MLSMPQLWLSVVMGESGSRLSCGCQLCLTWRRLGEEIHLGHDSLSFQQLALGHLRHCFNELLDWREAHRLELWKPLAEGIAATVPASSLGVEADPESQREEEKISTAVTKEKKTESKEVRDEKVKKEKKLKSTDRRCRSRSSRKQAPRERRRYRESYSSSHQRRRRGCSRSSDQVEVKEEPPEAELTRRATEAARGDTEGAERRTPRPEERKSARTEDWLRSWAWSSTRAVDCWRWASPTRTSSSS